MIAQAAADGDGGEGGAGGGAGVARFKSSAFVLAVVLVLSAAVLTPMATAAAHTDVEQGTAAARAAALCGWLMGGAGVLLGVCSAARPEMTKAASWVRVPPTHPQGWTTHV